MMPKLTPRSKRSVNFYTSIPEAAVAPVTAAPAAPAPRRVFAHDPADHISFVNADGTRSRICICPCDACWPPDGTECPDWG
jgi:hypothetical protein